MHRDHAAFRAAEALNARCQCVSLEVPRLREAVESRLAADGASAELAASSPDFFRRVKNAFTPLSFGDAS